MAKYDNNFIVCDVETGGLPDRLKKVATIEVALTEIALVAVDNETLQIIDKESWLIKPYSDVLIYEPEAAAVSGISKQLCEQKGEDISVVFTKVCKFLSKQKKGSKLPYLVGHNIIRFDLTFIENLFKMMGSDLFKYLNPEIKDTMVIGREKWIESSSFNLQTCCSMAGVEHTQAHRALPDTIATANLFIYYMSCLRGIGVSIRESEQKERFRDKFEF